MEFTERQHAFISAAFYRALGEQNLPNYRDAFRLAVRMYAEQRGFRMAQRAIRDGKPLSFPAYRHYKEWSPTPEAGEEFPNSAELYMENGNLMTRVFACPWSAQYLEMGLLEGAMDYCEDLDVAICRGFNPKLHYELKQVIHEKQDYCLHCHHNPEAEMDAEFGPPKPQNQRDFAYHCGHVYFTLSRVLTAVYGSVMPGICTRVIEEFAGAYGQEMADVVLQYRAWDFDVIESEG